MTIEQALRNFIAGLATVEEAGLTTDIYPVFLPEQHQGPGVTYRKIPKGNREYTMEQESGPNSDTYRVTFWSGDYMQAAAMGEDLADAIGADVDADTLIPGAENVQVLDEADVYEPVPEIVNLSLLGRYLDVLIQYDPDALSDAT
jgi:hypothetical protein